MLTPPARRLRLLILAGCAAAGTVGLLRDPPELLAQETRCFIVACTGNVCVWTEIKCPKTEVAPPP